MQHTILKVITPLLGLVLMGLTPLSQAAFYDGPLWDAHSHVDTGSGGNETRADRIADAINGVSAGTPGVGRIVLFPKICLDNYMLNTLATDAALTNPDRLITGIGFQNKPSDTLCNNGGWKNYDTSTPYDPAADQFLNDVETRAAGGSFQWLGEVALYGKEGEVAEIKADLFDPVIKARIIRVLDIAATNGLPVTIHHTVTDINGNPIGNLNTGSPTPTAAERFLSILQEHVDTRMDNMLPPADIVWAHWGGLSTPQAIQGIIDQFPNLYFDLAWFHKAGLTANQNRLLDSNCNIGNLVDCIFTPEWKALLSNNSGRFLAGLDAGTNTEYRDNYPVRELILRTALGTLDATDARIIAAVNPQELSGFVPVPADGDITRDGVVDAADILLGQQVLGGTATLSTLQFKHGDVAPLSGGVPAPDGQFTLGDVLVIQRKALGQVSF